VGILYTSNSGTKSDNKLPTINLKPIGYYELIQQGSILETGKIDTLGRIYHTLLVQFCKDGIKYQDKDLTVTHTIGTWKTDTLILGFGGYIFDIYINEYYKRIK
jgi:hypothetical protein